VPGGRPGSHAGVPSRAPRRPRLDRGPRDRPRARFLPPRAPDPHASRAAPGYDDQFVWTDFFVGDWKLELIESARPGSFVERFLARRGEGPHHLSIDVEEGRLGAYTVALKRDGLRIVDRGDYGTATRPPSSRAHRAGHPGPVLASPGVSRHAAEDHPTDPVATRDACASASITGARRALDRRDARLVPAHLPVEAARRSSSAGTGRTTSRVSGSQATRWS